MVFNTYLLSIQPHTVPCPSTLFHAIPTPLCFYEYFQITNPDSNECDNIDVKCDVLSKTSCTLNGTQDKLEKHSKTLQNIFNTSTYNKTAVWGTRFSNFSVKRDLEESFSDVASPTTRKRRVANELLLYEHNYCPMLPSLLAEADPNMDKHSISLPSILNTSTSDKVVFCKEQLSKVPVQHDVEVSLTDNDSSTPKKTNKITSTKCEMLYELNYCGMMSPLLDEGNASDLYNSNSTHVNNVLSKTDCSFYERNATLDKHSISLPNFFKTSTYDKVVSSEKQFSKVSVQHDLEISFTNIVSSTPKKKN